MIWVSFCCLTNRYICKMTSISYNVIPFAKTYFQDTLISLHSCVAEDVTSSLISMCKRYDLFLKAAHFRRGRHMKTRVTNIMN